MLKRGSVITLILVSIAIGTVYLLLFLTPEPPVSSMEKAGKKIAEARKLGAEKYALQLFTSSEASYLQAGKLMEAEYKRFILFRDFTKADSCYLAAIAQAEKAIDKSLANSKELEVSLDGRIRELTRLAGRYNQWISTLPIPGSVRKNFLGGKMLLAEAGSDYEKKEYNNCNDKVKKADKKLNDAVGEINKFLGRYFEDYHDWVSWYRESLERSRSKQSNLIVIDKIARSCSLYKNGKLKKTYSIELGPNWIGDKHYKGDKSTPEGRYHIVKKLDSKHTKYYKALLINYPNEEDKARFSMNKKKGVIPRKADIGGLIEIHGHGGKGADWTDGCIALRDEDMNDLYNRTDVSTPVTIIGSLVPLEKLMND